MIQVRGERAEVVRVSAGVVTVRHEDGVKVVYRVSEVAK